MSTGDKFSRVPDCGTLWVSGDGRVFSERLGRELSQSTQPSGHRIVSLAGTDSPTGKKVQKYVHRLMAKTFLPNPEGLPFVRHLDDIPDNNVLTNLAWGSRSDNGHDAVRNGRNVFALRDSCDKGHPYSSGDWRERANTKRFCQVCEREWRRLDRRRKAKETPFDKIPHGTNGYSNYMCRCAVCKTSQSNYQRMRAARKAVVK